VYGTEGLHCKRRDLTRISAAAVEVRNVPFSGGKICAWRQTGETFSFYPSLEALLKAVESPATATAAGIAALPGE